jgi:hypothetical protein
VISKIPATRAVLAKSALPFLALACATGCLRAELRPTLPMLSHSEGVDTRLEALDVGREREFVLRMTSGTPHRIRRAFLTVPTRLPCGGGLEPLAMAVDGSAGVVVAAGEHEVRASFTRDDFSMDLVLDLDLDEGRCVRTAVYSTSLPFEARSRPVVSVSFPVMGNPSLRGLRGIMAPQVGIGKWFGRLRLFGELGVGLSFCDERTCGKDSQSQNKTGLAIPFSLQATYRAAQWELPNATGFGLIGLRYSYVPVSLPTLAGDSRFAVHGLQAEVGFGITEVLKGNFRHLERAEDVEVVLPVGVVIDPAGEAAFSAGIAARFLIPL